MDLKKTLFLVSSKSGTTLEPNIFKQYFFERAKAALGGDPAKHFVAITDPGSALDKLASEEVAFRRVCYGLADDRRALFGAARLSA